MVGHPLLAYIYICICIYLWHTLKWIWIFCIKNSYLGNPLVYFLSFFRMCIYCRNCMVLTIGTSTNVKIFVSGNKHTHTKKSHIPQHWSRQMGWHARDTNLSLSTKEQMLTPHYTYLSKFSKAPLHVRVVEIGTIWGPVHAFRHERFCRQSPGPKTCTT